MRVLIADDDAISLRFLDSALQQLGCTTVTVPGFAAALATAADARFDLLLLDRNMPDGDGAELLAALRQGGVACRAIATSAEITAPIRAELRKAGFADCLEKPVSMARLQEFLRPWLDGAQMPTLDDAGGLAAIGGDRNSLLALRAMLASELSTLHDELDELGVDAQLARLHRLRASCGFCGTPKLAAATIAFEQALRRGEAGSQRDDFLACCELTIAALGT